MSPVRMIAFAAPAALALWAVTTSYSAPPPPRDSGPSRFVAPPPRAPLYPPAGPRADLQPEKPVAPANTAPTTTPQSNPGASGAPNSPPTKPGPAENAKPAQPAMKPAKRPPGSPALRVRNDAKPRAIAAKPRTGRFGSLPPSGVNDKSELSSPPAEFLVKKFDRLPEKRGLAANHYPASNENRIDLFQRYIADLGGGYVGVGTDQNLTFIAWARSSHAWLMDFDPVSVGINKIHVLFLKHGRDYPAFAKLWHPRNRALSRNLIRAHFRDDPYRPHVLRAFQVAHATWSPVPARLRELNSFTKRFGLSSFHNNPDDYRYLRQMALAGRIQALPGDLRGDTSMRAIHESALSIGVPIRMIYTSNAEDYFRAFPGGFRANMIDVPGDARSIVVRTISRKNYIYGQPPGEKFPRKAPFHYNVQTLDSFKAWLRTPRPLSTHTMMPDRKKIARGLSLIETSPAKKRAGQAAGSVAGPAKKQRNETPPAVKPPADPARVRPATTTAP